MTQQEYEKFEKKLLANGYRRWAKCVHNEDWCLIKGVGKSEQEDNRCQYQLIFTVYDFGKYADRDETLRVNPISYEAYVMVSRTANERIDLMLGCSSSISMEKMEEKAASFFEWVEKNFEL